MASPVIQHEANQVEWVAVSSSNLDAVAYSGPDFQRLYVRFNDGRRYVYHGVPPAVYAGLLAAPSKGGYLHRLVKLGGYGYEQI